MAVYDESQKGYRVFIGDLGHYVGRYDVEREFEEYGPIRDVWIARNPPGFAFVVYKYPSDAERAVRHRHGGIVCGRRVRVEHARPFEERLKEMNSRSRFNAKSRSRSRSPRPSRSKRSRSRSRRRSSPLSKSRSKRHRTKSRSRSRSKSRSRRSRRNSRSRSRSRSKSRRNRADIAPAQCNHGPTESNHGRHLHTRRHRKVGSSNQIHQPPHNHSSGQSHSHPQCTEGLPSHNYLHPLCHLCQLMCSHLQQPTSRATKSSPLGNCPVTGRMSRDSHYRPDWKPVFHPVANVGPSGGILSGSSKKRGRSSSHGSRSRSRSRSRSKDKSKSSKKHSRSSSTHRRSNESEKAKKRRDSSKASGDGEDNKNTNGGSPQDKNRADNSPGEGQDGQKKPEQDLPSNGKQADSDSPKAEKEKRPRSGSADSGEAEAKLGNGVVEKERSRKKNRHNSSRTTDSSEDSE